MCAVFLYKYILIFPLRVRMILDFPAFRCGRGLHLAHSHQSVHKEKKIMPIHNFHEYIHIHTHIYINANIMT